MTDVKLLLLHNNTCNQLTVCKQMSLGSLKNIFNKMCLLIIHIYYIFIKVIWHERTNID